MMEKVQHRLKFIPYKWDEFKLTLEKYGYGWKIDKANDKATLILPLGWQIKTLSSPDLNTHGIIFPHQQYIVYHVDTRGDIRIHIVDSQYDVYIDIYEEPYCFSELEIDELSKWEHQDIQYCIYLSIMLGNIEICQALYETYGLTFDYVKKCIKVAIIYNRSDLLRWLIETFGSDNSVGMRKLFDGYGGFKGSLEMACRKGHLDICKIITDETCFTWDKRILSKEEREEFGWGSDCDRLTQYMLLHYTARHGHLHICQWLKEKLSLSRSEIVNSKDEDHLKDELEMTISGAREKGYQDVYEWLIKTFNADEL